MGGGGGGRIWCWAPGFFGFIIGCPLPSADLELLVQMFNLFGELGCVSDQGGMPMLELLPDALQHEEDAAKPVARVRKPSKRYSGPEWAV
ncbi:hypothetical protein GUJ93_ZPchr0013g37619 [Zizania palustris]|uniref:Uncharacterized protein n=1 Tax=Zizania palustris TaxID=103762 RepID=A0A8J6BTS6_ZIZPA|nr:hypothetical protein GUJ93_ZPchr0013g37619 [Zizania palustris]